MNKNYCKYTNKGTQCCVVPKTGEYCNKHKKTLPPVCWSCKQPCSPHPDRFNEIIINGKNYGKHPFPELSFICTSKHNLCLSEEHNGKSPNFVCKKCKDKELFSEPLNQILCLSCGKTTNDSFYCLGDLGDRVYLCENPEHSDKIYCQNCFGHSGCCDEECNMF